MPASQAHALCRPAAQLSDAPGKSSCQPFSRNCFRIESAGSDCSETPFHYFVFPVFVSDTNWFAADLGRIVMRIQKETLSTKIIFPSYKEGYLEK